MAKLVEAVKFLSPYRKNWEIWELVFSKMIFSHSIWDMKGENEK